MMNVKYYELRICVLEKWHLKCLFYLLAPVEAEHVYSTVCKDNKVSHPNSCESSSSNPQVDAVYDQATAIEQDYAAHWERLH